MGHIRLGVLPTTLKWTKVVKKLELGEDAGAIAEAAFEAANSDLTRVGQDPALLQSLLLLAHLPIAARGPAFVEDAARFGLTLPNKPSLLEITAAISDAVDRHAGQLGGRTDLGEMAQMAAVESLIAIIRPRIPSLFGPSPEDVQREIGRLSSGQQFAVLAQEFFARLTQRMLQYYLSRELANHIGSGKRFENDGERTEFDSALNLHCREVSRIVREFAGGWYGKTVYQTADGVTPGAVQSFASYAFKKIGDELRKRQDAHG